MIRERISQFLTYSAKQIHISQGNSLLGRVSPETGAAEEITVGEGLEFDGTTLKSTGGGVSASDVAYDAATWDGVAAPPSKNAVRDKFVLVDAAVTGKQPLDADLTAYAANPTTAITTALGYTPVNPATLGTAAAAAQAAAIAAIPANMPDALTYEGEDPNWPCLISVTNVTGPTPLVLYRSGSINEKPRFQSNTVPFYEAKWYEGYWYINDQDETLYYASVQSDAMHPAGLTDWDVAGEQPVITADYLLGSYFGQLCKASDGWWRWDDDTWLEAYATAAQGALAETALQSIADGSITNAKIANVTITNEKIAAISPDGLVFKDTDGSRWRVNINTSGAVTSAFLMRAMVSDYFEATGITSESALKIESFFAALSPSVLSAFDDGSILKEGFSVISSSAIKTLKIRSLALRNDPTLGKCGLIFNGTSQSAKILFAAPIQNRTFICLQHYRQNFQTPITTAAVGWHVFNSYPYNGISGEALEFITTATSAEVYSTANSGAGKVQIPTPGVTRAFPPKSHMMAYTYNGAVANATAGAFTYRVEGGTVRTANAAANNSTLPPDFPFYHKAAGLFLGGAAASLGSNPPLITTFATERFCANSTGGWLMFNRVLTELEITEVFQAARLLFPKWKYVTEGDSIIQFTTPTFLTLPEIWGTNMTQVNHAAGGTTTPAIVAGLGTTRLTAASLASLGGGTPVVFDFFSSDSFAGYNAAAQYADYKTVWAFVRSANPDAVIIARTYTYGRPDGGAYTEEMHLVDKAGHEAFNTLMRADINAGFYDILVDSCSIADALNVGSAYAHHGLNPSIIVDTVHPSTSLSTAIGLDIIQKLEASGIAIR